MSERPSAQRSTFLYYEHLLLTIMYCKLTAYQIDSSFRFAVGIIARKRQNGPSRHWHIMTVVPHQPILGNHG